MPVIGGYEVTEMIQERESLVNRHAKLHTHIVALTVGAMKGDREKCLAAGRDDYLSKPMCIDDLSVALARSPQDRPWVSDLNGQDLRSHGPKDVGP